MNNQKGNTEKDRARGDTTVSGTGIRQEDSSRIPQISPPEFCDTSTNKNPNQYEVLKKHCKFSIPLLQMDSAKLLQSPETPGTDTRTATIFDLRLEDRKRVGELITKLAETLQDLAEVKESYETVYNAELHYKHKSDKLMKKVDVLNEKCQKLEDEEVQMKARHMASLTTLNNKVAIISDQFEHSAKQLAYFMENNTILQNENKRLRGKVIDLENQLTTSETINQNMSETISRQKSRVHELEKKVFQKKRRSKSRSTKSVEERQVEGNNSEDTKSETTFGTKPISDEEEILQHLFFRF